MSIGLTVPNWSATQGAAITISPAVIRDAAGNAITTYDGTQPLTATVWPGGVAPASFMATATWVSPGAGTIAVVITDAQTASVAPGEYEGMVRLSNSGSWIDAYPFTLTVHPFAGGIPAPVIPTIVTIAEAQAAVAACCGLDDSSLYQLVADATDALNAATGRILPLTTHDEVYPPELTRTVRLKQYPVADIDRIATGLVTVFTITNSMLTRATVSLVPNTSAADDAALPTGITFKAYSGGVPISPTTLTFTSYPTIAAMNTAINGLGSGWTSVLGGTAKADTPTTDINPDWGAKGCGQTGAWFRVFTRDLYQYDTNFKRGVISIYEDLYAGRRYPDRIWAASGPYGSVRVRYQAGYNNDPTVGPVTMPNGLKRAAFILIKAMLQQTQAGIQVSQRTSLSGWTITPAMMSLVADLVNPYKRRSIA